MLIKPIDKLLSIIYPNRCICCGKIIKDKYFCENCRGSIKPIELKTCDDCGLPLSLCSCKFNFYYFRGMVSCFENADKTRDAFYDFKFKDQYLSGGYFAGEMARRVKSKYFDVDFDFACTVPSHRSTVNERGYDQTEVLAKKMAKLLKIPFKRALCQPKRTVKQHETEGIEGRYSNVRGKYRVRKGADIKNKKILLADDIKTTGATLSECARELMLAGADEVYAVTALITFPNKKDQIS